MERSPKVTAAGSQRCGAPAEFAGKVACQLRCRHKVVVLRVDERTQLVDMCLLRERGDGNERKIPTVSIKKKCDAGRPFP